MSTNDSDNGALAKAGEKQVGGAKKKVWPQIKAAYLRGEGSLRTLAERFGVSLNTLEKTCRREGWRQEMAALGGIVTAEAAKSAAECGKQMGLTAAEFVERSIGETLGWLDRIERLAKADALDVEQLQKLVSAWRIAVTVGREAFRLDEPSAPAPTINLTKLVISPITEPQPGDVMIDCTNDDEPFGMNQN